MQCADGHLGYRYWHQYGDAASITSPSWLEYLDFNEDGKLEIDPDKAVELGVINSREYQFQLEDLYLSALALSLERFEFQLQWVGASTTFYEFLGDQISGRESQSSNTLTTRLESRL